MNASRRLAGLLFALPLLVGAEAAAGSCTTLVNSQFSWIQQELDDTGKMTLILNSWGNTRVPITSPTCEGNVLSGFAGTTAHSFTFEQFYLG